MTAPITPDERAAMRDTAHLTKATVGLYGQSTPTQVEVDYADTVLRLLDALAAAEAETANAREACRTLGRIVDQQCIDIAKIARSEHLVAENGDADWGAIWDRGFELADRAEKAEAEVARLRRQHEMDLAMHEAYRPEVSPAGDEDTMTEDMARAMFPHHFTDNRQPLRVFTETRSDTELREAEREAARHRARQALAVVRRHLPVRPDRETVERALRDAGLVEVEAVHEGHGAEEVIHAHLRPVADAVLAEWPGESRAQVQAEALRREADRLDAMASGHQRTSGYGRAGLDVIASVRREADRIEKGETR